MKRYAYGWITLLFFLVSIAGHWTFGWYAFRQDATEHARQPDLSEYAIEMGRDTFENWQSEFLQLIWQVVGLAYFLYIGSPASKENDDRLEAKVDELLRMHGGSAADELIREIDSRYFRPYGDSKSHQHAA
jgi:hypothetical protein